MNAINMSIKSISRKDLVNKISHSDLIKMDTNIRNIFFECNYDGQGNVFLFDELDPKLIAEYIVENVSLNVGNEVIYAYVCRTQMKIINKFYDTIRKGNLEWYVTFKNIDNNDKKIKKYRKLVGIRLETPLKRLRGI